MIGEDSESEENPTRERSWAQRLLPSFSTSFGVYLAETLGPILLVIALIIFAAFHFIRPAPPDRLTIAGGATGTRFLTVAQQYQKILARNGVKLNIVETGGSSDNLRRLLDPQSGVDIALVQSGTANSADPDVSAKLRSLGSVFYVPLTVFYRSAEPLVRLSQLQGKRIAIGAPGSGTRSLALALLKANEIEPGGATQLLDLEGEQARAALLNQRADAIVLSGDSAGAPTIVQLLHAPGIRLFDFPQADAYVRRFHYLNKLVVPAGAFDLGENLPSTSIDMLAPTAELVAHTTLHPALSDLLIEAAMEVHGGATVLQDAGQFPTPSIHDLPISEDAGRYYKDGKSFAYRYLPFWLASLLNRAVFVILPTFLVVIPALRYLPAIYNWRIKNRISGLYKRLMALERQSLGEVSDARRAALLAKLEHIEKTVIALKIPGSHADQLYVFREHMRFVRENLAGARHGAANRYAAGGPFAPGSALGAGELPSTQIERAET